MWQLLLQQIRNQDTKAIARALSLVENEFDGYQSFLESLPERKATPIIGITGPPGAGKSTLVDGLIKEITDSGKTVAVICVDPSSPFHLGALLGDRIRMNQWYLHPGVFIRSLASRGSVGGLHPNIIELTSILKAAEFDFIIIETVGVGQSEIEIAGLADTTMVVVVPEAGDEIQTMKSGLMEIADVFVVNKSDRPGADIFVKNLRQMLAPTFSSHEAEVPVFKTTATDGTGIHECFVWLRGRNAGQSSEKKSWLLTERLYYLIQKERMRNVNRNELRKRVDADLTSGKFNMYALLRFYEDMPAAS